MTRDPLRRILLVAQYGLATFQLRLDPRIRQPRCVHADCPEARIGEGDSRRQLIRCHQGSPVARAKARGIDSYRFTVWIAANAARTPVQVFAELPFGTIRGDSLRSASPTPHLADAWAPQAPRTSFRRRDFPAFQQRTIFSLFRVTSRVAFRESTTVCAASTIFW
jgi:hypothetical protein